MSSRYWSGLVSGVLVCEVLALAALTSWIMPTFETMYREFQGAPLPETTRLALSTPVRLGGPIGLVVLAVTGNLPAKEPPRVAILIVAAVAGAGLLAFLVSALYAPIFTLAGQIKAG